MIAPPPNGARREYFIRGLIALLLTYWTGSLDELFARIREAQTLEGYGMPDPLTD